VTRAALQKIDRLASVNVVTVDVSEELVLLKPEKPISLRPAQRLTVEFDEGIGALIARHIETTTLGLSIQLDAGESAAKDRLRARLLKGNEELAARSARLIEVLQKAARQIEDTFESRKCWRKAVSAKTTCSTPTTSQFPTATRSNTAPVPLRFLMRFCRRSRSRCSGSTRESSPA